MKFVSKEELAMNTSNVKVGDIIQLNSGGEWYVSVIATGTLYITNKANTKETKKIVNNDKYFTILGSSGINERALEMVANGNLKNDANEIRHQTKLDKKRGK